MTTKSKTEKSAEKKNGGEKSEQAPDAARIEAARTPDVNTIGKDKVAEPQMDEAISETVVFAFRLTRAERDEIHAATGSAKASRFVKAIVLAGARRDLKAIHEVIDQVHASSR